MPIIAPPANASSNPSSTAVSAKPMYRLLGPREDLLDVKGGDAAAIRERLQSLLSQWLRMENVTVLVGAGASKGQSGPLLTDLDSFALDAMAKLAASDAALERVSCVVEARRAALKSKTTKLTFEQWLSHLTNAA